MWRLNGHFQLNTFLSVHLRCIFGGMLNVPPPAPPATISAVEVRLCERNDLRCHWETANDLLEGVATTLRSSAESSGTNGRIVDLTATISGSGDLHVAKGMPERIRQS